VEKDTAMPNKRNDNNPRGKNEGFLTDFESFLSAADKLFPASEYLDIVGDFLESYATGRYEDAYEQLASTSPLRQGLSSEEWVAQRRQWNVTAHPARFRIAFIEDTEDLDDIEQELTAEDENEDTLEQPAVEVGWSLQFGETPLTSQLPELPVATAILKETGRHWFWTRYTLVEEDDEWFIDRLIDEGANALNLATTEIEQRLDTIAELASQRLNALAKEEDLEDDEDLDDEDLDDKDDEDLDDEDDEDLDDEGFMDTLLEMEEAFRVMTKGTHYNDALITQSPDKDPEPYEQNVKQAMVTNDMERAAVYLQQLAEHFPEQRSKAQEQLGLAYYSIAQTYEEDDEDGELDEDEEQANKDESQRFKELAEKTLLTAIETDQSTVAYIALAKLVFAQDRLEEAKTLLRDAQSLSTDQKQLADIEVGLGLISKKQEDTEQALRHFQRVAELNPDYEALWYNIGVLQSKLGRYEEAITNLKRNIETSPEQTVAYVELASIYITQNTPAKARQILQEGLEWDSEAPDLLAQLSIVYIRGNDLRTAQKYLQQAEDIDDEHELVQEARALYNERRIQQRAAIKPHKPQQNRQNKKKK
jgi:tetratricopeptide (TPR) repeat protein